MKLTSALHVRNLLAKLHPPLPKSPRESQQLLNILQSSFKRQLDDLHPSPRSSSAASDATISAPRVAPNSSATAAISHLNSILDHPLLDHDLARLHPQILTSKNAPYLFDSALLHDKVDVTVIEGCVEIYNREWRQERRTETAKMLGAKIATWFTSTTNAMREDFITNINLMVKVVPMMYQAALEHEVWEWLRILYEGDTQHHNPASRYNPQSREWLSIEDKFVAVMLRESIKRNDLNGAVAEYLQARTYRQNSVRAIPSNASDVSSRRLPLRLSWATVTAAILGKRHEHGVTELLYDELLESSSYHQPHSNLRRALLYIYRPHLPTSSLVYRMLTTTESREQFIHWKDSRDKRLQKILVLSILDAAELALKDHSRETSRIMLEFAELHFPHFISSQNSADMASRIEHARDEASVQSIGRQDVPLFPGVLGVT